MNPILTENKGFSVEGLGNISLSRADVVRQAVDQIEYQRLNNDWCVPSLYFCGPKASGKSIILRLLAQRLTDKGFAVYFYGPGDILGVEMLDALPQDEDVQMAVIIDDAPDTSSEILVLLQSERKNLVVIGAGVPRYFSLLSSRRTVTFKRYMSEELKLSVGSRDMKELIQYWKNKHIAEDTVVEEICTFLCDHCAGHFYPIVRFIEYALSDPAAEPFRTSCKDFKLHFFSHAFQNSATYKDVIDACFGRDLNENTLKMMSRVLGKKSTFEDNRVINKLAWYDHNKRDVMSSLLSKVVLKRVKPDLSLETCIPNEEPLKNEPGTFPPIEDHLQQQLESLIVEGLWHMQLDDFYCNRDDPIKPNVNKNNAIAYTWTQCVMKSIGKVLLQFHSRMHSGRVELVGNSANLNGIIKIQLNGAKNHTSGSLSVLEHINRMKGLCMHNAWVVLNFDTSQVKKTKIVKRKKHGLFPPSKVNLPAVFKNEENTTIIEKVYTFVFTENALYQGRNLIKQPAVKSWCRVLLTVSWGLG